MNILKKLFITDWLIIFYVFFCMIWIAIGWNHIETDPAALVLKYFGVLIYILVVVLLMYYVNNPLVRFIRYWYPLTLLTFFFTSATFMDTVIFKDYLDPVFQHFDAQIFGYQPGMVWGTKYDSFFVSEFFHFAYFSYYPMIFFIPLYVYLVKGNIEFIRSLFNVLFVFFTCYTVYLILPVVGGRMLEGAEIITKTYRHGMFTHIMVYLYRGLPHWGGAFPSSHVAVALTISLLSFRYLKYFSWILIINTIFLSIATVFCHYHYFIDVIAGIIYGVVMFGISEVIYAFKFRIRT